MAPIAADYIYTLEEAIDTTQEELKAAQEGLYPEIQKRTPPKDLPSTPPRPETMARRIPVMRAARRARKAAVLRRNDEIPQERPLSRTHRNGLDPSGISTEFVGRRLRVLSGGLRFQPRRHQGNLCQRFSYSKPRTPVPEFEVEFRPYADVNNVIRMRDGKLTASLSDLLKDAPDLVLGGHRRDSNLEALPEAHTRGLSRAIPPVLESTVWAQAGNGDPADARAQVDWNSGWDRIST